MFIRYINNCIITIYVHIRKTGDNEKSKIIFKYVNPLLKLNNIL